VGYLTTMGAATYGLIVTILVMVGIAVLILLFERRRAREIEKDLRHPHRDGEVP
jgi:uncharacterized membrane protein